MYLRVSTRQLTIIKQSDDNFKMNCKLTFKIIIRTSYTFALSSETD